eukprot:CAMPEP_0197025936 /NCGR_PEP_ID=MMETSP1384-20130603/6130_1 /TAXON_ID=29189 /ORGANISM="Ammonia sp." /LENGTH=149 /DNA_ID=CAMNT_0042454527 /DNA_START=255 /DNA_END=704 /DNA_ORIENTATION=-
MVCNDCELINCGGTDSCRSFTDMTGVAFNTKEDFLLECTGDSACKFNEAAGGVWEIHCYDNHIKGIKCGGYESCQNANFYIYGSSQYDEDAPGACTVDKIECDGTRSCQGANFYFVNAEVSEFVCGGLDSCDEVSCRYGWDYSTGDCQQ